MTRRTLLGLTLFALLLPAAVSSQTVRPPVQLTVTADGHPLALWMRAAAKPKGVIVLLHGRTWSSLPDFDLQVPGENRSVMQAFVTRGYTVYALDARGYGSTLRDSTGWLTPNRAAKDVAEALRFVHARHPSLPLPTLVGWSYGSMVAHLTLQQYPTLASAVVLFGYPRDPTVDFTVSPDTGLPPRQTTTAKSAAEDFIAPGAITPRALAAYVAAALKADPVRVDWKSFHEWNQLSPSALKLPVLLLHGEFDPYTPVEVQAKAFVAFGSPDREWIILAGGDHAALVEKTLPAFVTAILNFIERPTAH